MRADIQGLRMLAVTLVVVFHLFPKALTGGYVGVDVFFVISGFLITGHLLREVNKTGRIAIADFWARRARRLLPAALLVLVVCLGLTLWVIPEPSRLQNLSEISAASVYILNWVLAANAVDYMAEDNPASLVQHYWSLSVEEQFYIVWPVLLTVAMFVSVWVYRGFRARGDRPAEARVRRGAIIVALSFVIVASLVYSIYETTRAQSSAYFFTTTRAWEFALGGIVALVPTLRLAAPLRAGASVVTLIAIVGSAYFFGPQTPFPGWIAAIPVGATALLIWLGDSDAPYAPQRLARPRWVQYIGDISYSIYLWHWPLIITVAVVAVSLPGWGRALIVVPLTLVLAGLTKKFVEDPVRNADGDIRKPLITFGVVAVSTALLALFAQMQSASIRTDIEVRQAVIQEKLNQGTTSPGSESTEGDGTTNQPTGPRECSGAEWVGANAVLNNCIGAHDYTDTVDPTLATEDTYNAWFDREPGVSHCTVNNTSGHRERACEFTTDDAEAPTVLLVGDSHALQLVTPVQQLTQDNNWNFRFTGRDSCSVFGVYEEPLNESDTRCVQWRADTLASILADPTVDVVLVSQLAGRTPDREATQQWFRQAESAGKQVVVIGDNPGFGVLDPNGEKYTGPACVAAHEGVNDACAWQDTATARYWLNDTARDAGVPVVDLRDVICPDGTCHMLIGGVIAYIDGGHFTMTFANSLAGWLSKQLKPIVTGEEVPSETETQPKPEAVGPCTGANAVLNDCSDPHAYTDTIDPTLARQDSHMNWFQAEPAKSACTESKPDTQRERSCVFETSADAPTVLLLGDSHAEHIAAPIQRVAQVAGWNLRLESREGCSLFSRNEVDADSAAAIGCVAWSEQELADAAADPNVDVIIMSEMLGGRAPAQDEAESGISTLMNAGKRVIAIRDNPAVGIRDHENKPSIAPDCVAANAGVDDACSWTDESRPYWLTEAATAVGADVVDMHDIICPAGECHLLFGGVIAYLDRNHFTLTFAKSLTDWFSQQLTPLIAAGQH